MLFEPQPTNYDLRFNLFGFPVRVHPLFFLMPLLLGNSIISLASNAGVAIIVLVIVFFLSILIHELGHAFAIRYFGNACHIVLYWMGGLAITGSGASSWQGGGSRSVTPKAQIIISLAGPVFGFLFAAVLLGILYGIGGSVRVYNEGFVPLLIPNLQGTMFQGNEAMTLFFFVGLWANIFWNVLNLMPVYPLDGGQIMRQVMILSDPWNGVRKSLIVSLVAAICLVLFAFAREDRFIGFLFAFLAFGSYQELTRFGGSGGRPW